MDSELNNLSSEAQEQSIVQCHSSKNTAFIWNSLYESALFTGGVFTLTLNQVLQGKLSSAHWGFKIIFPHKNVRL